VDDLEKVGTKAMLLGDNRVRRYTTSRGIRINPKSEDSGWEQAPASMESLQMVAGASAADVVLDATGAVKWFTSDKPIRRLKSRGGALARVSPLSLDDSPKVVDAFFEEILNIFDKLREETTAARS
jgi:hypothetical protein